MGKLITTISALVVASWLFGCATCTPRAQHFQEVYNVKDCNTRFNADYFSGSNLRIKPKSISTTKIEGFGLPQYRGAEKYARSHKVTRIGKEERKDLIQRMENP